MGSTSTIAAAAGRRIGSTIAAGHRRRRETNGWPKAANGHAAGGLAERWAPCVALPPQSLEPLEPVARSHQRRAIAGSVGAIVEAPLGARPRTGAALVATQAPAGLERLRSPVERAAGGCRSRQVKATESKPPPMERPETPNTPIANPLPASRPDFRAPRHGPPNIAAARVHGEQWATPSLNSIQ